MKKLIIAALLCSVLKGQNLLSVSPEVNRSSLTVANLGTLTPSSGWRVAVRDGLTGTDCTAGGGSIAVWCYYNGSAWVAIGTGSYLPLTGGALTGPLSVTTIKDGNGNPFLISSATASAVDSLTVTNAATANPATVTVGATGSDGNINLSLVGKGTGNIQFPNGLTTGSSPPAATFGTGWGIACAEGTAPSSGAASGVDLVWCDSTQHGWMSNFNNGGNKPISQTIASGSSTLGTASINSAACATVVTASATGTLTTDVVTASFNGDPTAVTGYIPATSGMLTIIPFPTANNVNFKVCNLTSSTITPGAVTLNWRVIR